MRNIPREPAFDSTLALLADPYRFIAKGCARHRSNLFEARILMRRTVCMSGPIAAALFYDGRRFMRQGAAPEPLRTTLFDEAASWRHLQARHARRQAQAWGVQLVEQTRAGTLAPGARKAPGSHRPAPRRRRRAAADVELLNLLRPTVAVPVFIVFAAHALHEHPRCRALLESGEPGAVECFVQEVRRFYPLFPAVAARARDEFEWHGHSFRQGQRVLFDLYGTNHDPRVWELPQEFRPERFAERRPGPYEFVPQGSGDPSLQHRCPGEGVVLAVMKVSVEFLARRLGYDVPAQDLRVDFRRLPALVRSHFIMRDVMPLPHPAWPSFAFTPS